MSRPRRRKRKPVSRLDLARLARRDELLAEIEARLMRMRLHQQMLAQTGEAFPAVARSSQA